MTLFTFGMIERISISRPVEYWHGVKRMTTWQSEFSLDTESKIGRTQVEISPGPLVNINSVKGLFELVWKLFL